MTNMRSMAPRLAAILLLGAVGCGLLSKDISKATFELPTKHFTFTAPAGIPAQQVPCGPGTPLATCPAVTGLTLSCDSGVCTAHVPVSVAQRMDLKNEVSVLKNITASRSPTSRSRS